MDAVALEERRSLRAYGLRAGERQFDVALTSARLGLSARIDLVITRPTAKGREAVVVDYKLSEREAPANYKLQLAAYALLVEEVWGMPVRQGFLYHLPQRRAEAVPLTLPLRRKVSATVTAIRHAILSEQMPSPPTALGKCISCEFRRFCNDVV